MNVFASYKLSVNCKAGGNTKKRNSWNYVAITITTLEFS